MHRFTPRSALSFTLAAAAFLAAPSAFAQSAEQRYQAEVARCNAGQTQQDRATCLREAGAARDEARKGNLATPASTDMARNATDRCKLQPAADQAACMQRIEGTGVTTTQGSVEGGGVIRETVTPVKP
ncbi:MAG: hypothetical protein V4757_17430 [Pseudomonadota bacterium]